MRYTGDATHCRTKAGLALVGLSALLAGCGGGPTPPVYYLIDGQILDAGTNAPIQNAYFVLDPSHYLELFGNTVTDSDLDGLLDSALGWHIPLEGSIPVTVTDSQGRFEGQVYPPLDPVPYLDFGLPVLDDLFGPPPPTYPDIHVYTKINGVWYGILIALTSDDQPLISRQERRITLPTVYFGANGLTLARDTE